MWGLRQFSGSASTIQVLVANNADVEARDSSGKTPLLVACEQQSWAAMAALVWDHNADVNATDEQGATLRSFVEGLEADANLGTARQGGNYRTPLEFVEELLDEDRPRKGDKVSDRYTHAMYDCTQMYVMHARACTHAHVCVRACVCVCVCVCMHACKHRYACMCLCTYACMCVRTHVSCARTNTHTVRLSIKKLN